LLTILDKEKEGLAFITFSNQQKENRKRCAWLWNQC